MMNETVTFYHENFGKHLPIVVRTGDKITGVFSDIDPVHMGYCELTRTDDTEVIEVKRPLDGNFIFDWRLASAFALYPQKGKNPARMSDGTVVLISTTDVWITRDISNTPFHCEVPIKDIYQLLVDEKVKPPYMAIAFGKNTGKVVSELRITYSSAVVDWVGKQPKGCQGSGIVDLAGIRKLIGVGATIKDMKGWRSLLRKGELEQSSQEYEVIKDWNDITYSIFYKVV